MRRAAQRTALAVAAVFVAVAFGGCVNDVITDEIATELTLAQAGPAGLPLEVRKRFRFSHDPHDARGVYLREARLRLLQPIDGDLAFMHRLEVYALLDDDTPVLVAVAEGAVPGDRTLDFDIVLEEDLRRFARDDSRIAFSFLLYPSAWGRPFPEGGYTVLADATIEIEL